LKNILIIGASSGIGLKLAQQLSAEHLVYATYNKHPKNDAENIVYHHLNVTDESLSLDFIPEVLHGFVYCPGSILLKPISRITPEDFKKDYEVNVLGMIKILQKILPNLKKASLPSVVLLSSVAVQTGMTFHSVVSASKGAIEGLTKSLAAEFAPYMRVNCVAPSLVDTPLAETLINTEEKIIQFGNRHPLKRIGNPDDIANMIEFLLSEKSHWMTGQIIHVDGGMGAIK